MVPIYQDLSKKVEQYIADNDIIGRLPGVLRLSQNLNCNKVTLTKALKFLEQKGILRINGTKGTFVISGKQDRPHYHTLAVIGSEQPCNNDVLTNLNAIAKPMGYSFIYIAFDNETFKNNPRLLLNFPVDGFLFYMSVLRKEQEDLLRIKNFPIVATADWGISKRWMDVVECNHEEGYGILINHLHSLGHHRIAFIEYKRSPEYQPYLNKIIKIFQNKLGDDYDPKLIYIREFAETLYADYGEKCHAKYTYMAFEYFLYLPEPPTAVIVLNEDFISGITAHGLKIPNDISVAILQYDSILKSDNDITKVVFYLNEGVKWACRKLISRVQDDGSKPEFNLLPPTFFPGKTTSKYKRSKQ